MITFLALCLGLVSLGVSLVLAARLKTLTERLALIEREPEMVPLGARHECKGEPWGRGLRGQRIALKITQDHPHPVFANLLGESLQREEAVLDDASKLKIEGEVVGNGYADVYFRAEIVARLGDETLFTLSDRPPHGDRPANLAAEIVQRLQTEMEKHERRSALRELD